MPDLPVSHYETSAERIIYFGLTPIEVEALLNAAGHMIQSSGACYPGIAEQATLESARAKLRRPLEGGE